MKKGKRPTIEDGQHERKMPSVERKENTKQRKENDKRRAVFGLREKKSISAHFREVSITVGAVKKCPMPRVGKCPV